MGQARAKNFSLDTLVPLTPELIELQGIQASELCYLKFNQKEYGPFTKESVKEMFDEDPAWHEQVEVAEAEREVWLSSHDMPFFERRLPELVEGTQSDADDEFYILENGQKAGPYMLHEIQEKLRRKELLYTDSCLPLNGEKWEKISHFPQFNRRHHTHELPASPRTQKQKIALKPSSNAEEALVGLAFYGQVQTQKIQDTTLPLNPAVKPVEQEPLAENSESQQEVSPPSLETPPTTPMGSDSSLLTIEEIDENTKKEGFPWGILVRAILFLVILGGLIHFTKNIDRYLNFGKEKKTHPKKSPQSRTSKTPRAKKAIQPVPARPKSKAAPKPTATKTQTSNAQNEKRNRANTFKKSKAYQNYQQDKTGDDQETFAPEDVYNDDEAYVDEFEEQEAPQPKKAKIKKNLNRDTLDPEIVDPDAGPESEEGLFEEEVSF